MSETQHSKQALLWHSIESNLITLLAIKMSGSCCCCLLLAAVVVVVLQIYRLLKKTNFASNKSQFVAPKKAGKQLIRTTAN